MPISLAISIFRYRLWDIDLLIRRTLVYSVLTSALALLYFRSVLALQRRANPLLGRHSSQRVIMSSTLLIAAIAALLNSRMQRALDWRFYHRQYDSAQIAAAFAATLRNMVELERLTGHRQDTVEASVQPEHASMWVCPIGKP
jgi:two-component system NarL family sensor kinase